ncbi:hypothetical protein ALC62_06385 [Cyphomyrmex costatus]|uniref:Uncharacterized protein n=1 Tax=Cyphomyrmex costatus TaxID=456900 RepID=A0A195CQP8_9HYME|nr:hypothetical protein ALC62_06385 [Cyphomyrmex costatus]
MPLGRPFLLKHSTIRYMVSVEDQHFFVNVRVQCDWDTAAKQQILQEPPQLQEQRDDQYVALERRRNGSYVIGRLWCSWGAERGRGKGTFSRRFLEKQRRGDQAWLRPDMPSYEREKMMRRRVAPRFCISLSLAGWLTGTSGRDCTTRTERQRAQGRLGNRSHPSPLINLSGSVRIIQKNLILKINITRQMVLIFLLLVIIELINAIKNKNCDIPRFIKVPHKLTALCCGIPCVGVRVRAVQSSQNPEKAPGFTRAAVGETPCNSRIRLSPNIFCIRVVKDSRRYTALLLCGNDKGRFQRIGTFVIYPVDPGFCRM